MISAKLSYGMKPLVGIVGCVMLLAASNVQAQDYGLAAEIVAVGPTAGGIFPGGFLAEFLVGGEFFELNGKSQIAVEARVPTHNLTQYTGLTAANVEGSRAVFVTSRPGVGRICKIVCYMHSLDFDSVGEAAEPSGPPFFNPHPTTGVQSKVYLWDFQRRSRGSLLFNFGHPLTYVIMDQPGVVGNPLIPRILPDDKLKLVFVGGDNVIAKTHVYPNFFWELGPERIRAIGDPLNTARFLP